MADELKGNFLKLTNSDMQISLDKVAIEKQKAAIQNEKFKKIFDFFDKDKNGTLSQDEIADLIEKITAAALKNGNMDIEDDEIRELLETTTNSDGKTLLDEGIDVNELFSFVKTLETDETEETNPTDETIAAHEPDTSIDENGNEVTDYCEGDVITKRVIKSTDDKGNTTETTLEFQEGKVVRKQIVKNGNTVSTSIYSYNDQDGNQSVTIEIENADRSTVTTNVSAVDASGDYAENNFISRHTTKIDGTTIDVEYTDNGMTSTTTNANGEMSSSVYSQKSITAFDNNELKEVSSRTIALENGKIVVTQRFNNSVIKEYYNGNNIDEFSAANPEERQLVKQIIVGLNGNNQAQELTRYANGSYSVRVFNTFDDYDNNAEPIEQYTMTTLDYGETLSNLANKYGTNVDAIKDATGDISNPNLVGIERSIRIPAYNDELTAQRASFAQARNKAVVERAGNAEKMIYMSQQATLELSSNYSNIEEIAKYIVKNVYNTEGLDDKQIRELVNSLDYSLTFLNGGNAGDALRNINKNHKVSYPVQLTGKHKTIVDTLQSIGINPTKDNQRIYQAAHALISQDEAEGSNTKNYEQLLKLLKSEQAKNNPDYVTQSMLKEFGINSYSDSKKLYDDIKKSGHPQLALLEKCGMDLANPYDQATLVRIYNYCEALANAQEGSLEGEIDSFDKLTDVMQSVLKTDPYNKLTSVIQSALKKHKDSIPKSDSFALTLDNGKLTESEMIALKRDVYLSLGIDLFAKGELDWRTEQKLKTAQKKILTASVLSNVYSSLAQIYAHKNDGSFVGTAGTLIEKGINLIDDDAFTTDDQKAERYQQYAERYAAMADVSTWGANTPLDGPYINALGAGISMQSKDLDKLLEYCSEHSDSLDIWNDKKFIELFENVHGTPIISAAKKDCKIDSWITGVGDIAATLWAMGKIAPLFEFIAPEASALATSSRGGKIASTILGNSLRSSLTFMATDGSLAIARNAMGSNNIGEFWDKTKEMPAMLGESAKFGAFAGFFGSTVTAPIIKALFGGSAKVAPKALQKVFNGLTKGETITASELAVKMQDAGVKFTTKLGVEAVSFTTELAGFTAYELVNNWSEISEGLASGQMTIGDILKDQAKNLLSFKVLGKVCQMHAMQKHNQKSSANTPDIKITPMENGKYRIEYPDNRTVTYDSYEEAYGHINNYYEEALIYNTLEEGLNNENVIEIDENSRMEKTSNGYRVVLSNGKSYEASSVREAMERANSEYTHLTNEATLRKNGKLKLSENFEITFDEANNAYRGRLNGVEFEASSMDDAIQKATIKATVTEIERQFKKSDKIKTFDNITVERLKNKGYKLTSSDADGTVRICEGRTLEEALEKVYNRTVETPVPTPSERPVTSAANGTRTQNIPLSFTSKDGKTVGRTLECEVTIDESTGKVTDVKTNLPGTMFPIEVSENLSQSDVLILTSATDGNSLWRVETAELVTNSKLIYETDLNAGTNLDAKVYEKGDEVLLVVNGWHGDKSTGSKISAIGLGVANAKGIPNSIINLNSQAKDLESLYNQYKSYCDANGKKLVVSGYSQGGTLVENLVSNHKNDNSTQFFTFNSNCLKGDVDPRITAYVIKGDGRSDAYRNGSVVVESTFSGNRQKSNVWARTFAGAKVTDSPWSNPHDLLAYFFATGVQKETVRYEKRTLDGQELEFAVVKDAEGRETVDMTRARIKNANGEYEWVGLSVENGFASETVDVNNELTRQNRIPTQNEIEAFRETIKSEKEDFLGDEIPRYTDFDVEKLLNLYKESPELTKYLFNMKTTDKNGNLVPKFEIFNIEKFVNLSKGDANICKKIMELASLERNGDTLLDKYSIKILIESGYDKDLLNTMLSLKNPDGQYIYDGEDIACALQVCGNNKQKIYAMNKIIESGKKIDKWSLGEYVPFITPDNADLIFWVDRVLGFGARELFKNCKSTKEQLPKLEEIYKRNDIDPIQKTFIIDSYLRNAELADILYSDPRYLEDYSRTNEIIKMYSEKNKDLIDYIISIKNPNNPEYTKYEPREILDIVESGLKKSDLTIEFFKQIDDLKKIKSCGDLACPNAVKLVILLKNNPELKPIFDLAKNEMMTDINTSLTGIGLQRIMENLGNIPKDYQNRLIKLVFDNDNIFNLGNLGTIVCLAESGNHNIFEQRNPFTLRVFDDILDRIEKGEFTDSHEINYIKNFMKDITSPNQVQLYNKLMSLNTPEKKRFNLMNIKELIEHNYYEMSDLDYILDYMDVDGVTPRFNGNEIDYDLLSWVSKNYRSEFEKIAQLKNSDGTYKFDGTAIVAILKSRSYLKDSRIIDNVLSLEVDGKAKFNGENCRELLEFSRSCNKEYQNYIADLMNNPNISPDLLSAIFSENIDGLSDFSTNIPWEKLANGILVDTKGEIDIERIRNIRIFWNGNTQKIENVLARNIYSQDEMKYAQNFVIKRGLNEVDWMKKIIESAEKNDLSQKEVEFLWGLGKQSIYDNYHGRWSDLNTEKIESTNQFLCSLLNTNTELSMHSFSANEKITLLNYLNEAKIEDFSSNLSFSKFIRSYKTIDELRDSIIEELYKELKVPGTEIDLTKQQVGALLKGDFNLGDYPYIDNQSLSKYNNALEMTKNSENINSRDLAVLKFATLLGGLSVDNQKCAIIARNLLEHNGLTSDITERVFNLIQNRNWFELYKQGKIDIEDIAVLFREPNDFELAKIISEQDFSSGENQELSLQVETVLNNIYATAPIVKPTKVPYEQSKFERVEFDGNEYKVVDFTNPNLDLEALGFPKGLTKEQVKILTHFIKLKGTDDFNSNISASGPELMNILCDEVNNTSLSAALVDPSHIDVDVMGRNCAVVIELMSSNYAAAYHEDFTSPLKKGYSEFKDYLTGKLTPEQRNYTSDVCKKYLNLSDSEYVQFYKALSRLDDVSRIKSDIIINEGTPSERRISAQEVVTAIEYINNSLSNITRNWDELIVYNPKIKALLYKIETPVENNILENCPAEILAFAKKYNLPIYIAKSSNYSLQ